MLFLSLYKKHLACNDTSARSRALFNVAELFLFIKPTIKYSPKMTIQTH